MAEQEDCSRCRGFLIGGEEMARRVTSFEIEDEDRQLIEQALPYSGCTSFGDFIRSACYVTACRVIQQAARRGEIEYREEREEARI